MEFNEVEELCKNNLIENYKILDDGSVDVEGDVFLMNQNFKKIPIKFNRVSRNFFCSRNKLATLENSPNYVGGYFNCDFNNLNTLLNGPKFVIGNYSCRNNNLKDVYGLSKFFNCYLDIIFNPICDVLNLSIINYGDSSYFPINMEEISYYDNLVPRLVRFAHLINEYKVIRNQDTVIESRLLDALSEMGTYKLPKNLEFEHYKLI